MASPSSSASPPAAYMHPPPTALSASTKSSTPPLSDSSMPDNRQRLVQKVIERSHLSSVARGLRTRLSYASYKAAHNLPHATLLELEKQPPVPPGSAVGRGLGKRKAPGSNNYYNNPATQGGPPVVNQTARRTHYPHMGASGSGSKQPNGVVVAADPANGATPGHSLFASILAPPPGGQARTILNASDPPVNMASRPPPSPRVQKGSVRTIMEAPRATAAAQANKDSAKSPQKKSGRKADSKGKQKETSQRGKKGVRGDVDAMEAAATLTSMLMQRGSLPSDAGSDAGSARSYSQYAQSSTRDAGGEAPRKIRRISPGSPQSSHALPPGEGDGLAPPLDVPDRQGSSTPHPPPTDNEAANLMLFLATSPSPARKGKNERDEAAYRALSGNRPGVDPSGSARPARVLFPTASESAQGSNLSGRLPSTSPQRSSGLARNAPGYTSSMSSIGSELEGRPSTHSRPSSTNPSHHIPSTNYPPSTSAPSSPSRKDAAQASEMFTGNEYVVSQPNPMHSTAARPMPAGSSGLRMDVGRKLFEEQQHQQQQQRYAPPPRQISQEEDRRSLGPPAGIHH